MSTISLSQSMITRRLTWVITHVKFAGVPLTARASRPARGSGTIIA